MPAVKVSAVDEGTGKIRILMRYRSVRQVTVGPIHHFFDEHHTKPSSLRRTYVLFEGTVLLFELVSQQSSYIRRDVIPSPQITPDVKVSNFSDN